MVKYDINAAEVFEDIKKLLKKVNDDLADATILEQYKNGDKDAQIKDRYYYLLEDVSNKLVEQYAYAQTVGDNYEQAWKQVYFYSDMYYELVSGLVELVSLRNNDIEDSTELVSLFDEVEAQMSKMNYIADLDKLRNYLKNKDNTFYNKPFLQDRVNGFLVLEQGLYYVNPARSINNYQNNDVLAYISESVLQSAEISGLPDGVTIDETTGEIIVSDSTVLQPGTYTVSLKAIDSEGGETTDFIDLQIGDEEPAEYTLTEPKQVQKYIDGDVLGTVTGPDNTAIEKAVLTAGDIPAGMYFNGATGEISVAVAALLLPGAYGFPIRTIDALNRVTDHSITIYILANTPTVYDIAPPKHIDEYEDGDTVVSTTDDDGTVISIEVTNLPAGTTLNTTTGKITVSNASLLVPGIYTVSIITTDTDGFKNTSTVTLVIGRPSDVEATYNIAPSKTITSYQNEDILAVATDTNGPVVKAIFISGQIPPGVALNRYTGEFIVADIRNLIVGSYACTISTLDVSGGITEHNLTIPIGADAIYTVKRGRSVTSYNAGEVTAKAFDPRGEIITSQVTTGTLPAGLALSPNSEIIVSQPALLVAGTYSFTVKTTTTGGGISNSSLVLTFLPDAVAVYTLAAPKNIDSYKKDDVIGTVSDADGDIVNAALTRGALPRGLKLDTITGQISVETPEDLLSGNYAGISITTTDETQGRTVHNLTISFLKDVESVYIVNPPKELSTYNNNDTLAYVTDEDGIVISAVLNAGELPNGTSFNTTTGEIKVIDKTKLKKGVYNLVIETNDAVNGSTINSIQIIISANTVPDTEAVYTVAAPKALGSYVNGDILASASDADGAIVTAVITSGTLPPGTEIIPTGIIRVTNKNALALGTYPLSIFTTDSLGNTTSNSIQVVIGNSAMYQYIRAIVNIEGAVNGNLLAHPVDPKGSITLAALQSGTLPAGLALNTSNGDITISNAASLVAGTFTFTVRLTSSGGATNVPVTIQFINDTEAVYTINAPKNRDAYKTGDSIATVTDADGPVVSASVVGGSLPRGMQLNNDGSITVSDPTLLVGGTYTNISILTVDNTGGKTTSVINLTLKTDKEAAYTIYPPNFSNRYNNGDILASVSDEDGAIVSAQIKQGILPYGASFNTITGEIRVIDKTQVREGNYNMVIDTCGADGGFTENSITIVIYHKIDNEALCTIAPPRNIDAYINGDILVAVSDPDSVVVSAVLISGAMAPGTILNANGSITVSNSAALVAGSYIITIRTTDTYSETTDLNITIVILPDHECTYVLSPVKKFNLYINAEVLAIPIDADGIIISSTILSGTLAAGLTLNADGRITVSNQALLTAGTSNITVKLTDATGGTSNAALSIVIGTDSVAVYTTLFARYKHSYRNADLLAFAIDPDGTITASTVTSGTLPAGTSLAANSNITVSARNSLVGASNTLSVRTVDSSGGITNHNITLVVKAITDRTLFCKDVGLRVNDIANIYSSILTSSDTINVALMDLTIALFARYASGLADATFVSDFKAGLKDATLRSDITSMTSPTSEAIKQRKIDIAATTGAAHDRAVLELKFYTDLYNEQVVMAMELAGLRNSDLLSALLYPSNDLNVMFESVRTQLLGVSTSIPELSFLKDNINDRSGSLFSGKVNLIAKITGLYAALTI